MRNFLILMMLLLPIFMFAAYFDKLPTDVTQPNGEVLHLFASGDEYNNWLLDADGFTIIQSPTDGYYYYAQQAGENLEPSPYRIGSVNPSSIGITPNLHISSALWQAKAAEMQSHMPRNLRTPTTGTINNICIFIRFADQAEFPDPRSFYDSRFNAQGNVYSLRDYYNKVSYGQLDISTTFYPLSEMTTNVSYVDSNPRAYYEPFNEITNPLGYTDDNAFREQTLIANAVAAIESQVPADLNIDADNDGVVDNVCFVIRGPHTAWAELLWAHRWSIFVTNVFIHGKAVIDYTWQPENQNQWNVLSHEMFHSLGAPDLYHYTYNGMTPAGAWDIMETGQGHMGAYMKYKYGHWIQNMTTISQTGDYSLSPLGTIGNNVYRINVTGHPNEYFILEYRKRNLDQYEMNLPSEGLLIYRINTDEGGNSNGPPDEVYIYRPGGNQQDNGSITDAPFSSTHFNSEFNDYSNPQDFLTFSGTGHINIYNVGSIGETISFHYSTVSTSTPATVDITSPNDQAVLAYGTHLFSTQIIMHNSEYLDAVVYDNNQQVYVLPGFPPNEFNWVTTIDQLGIHQLKVVVTGTNQLVTTKEVTIRIIDPAVENEFSWITATPSYTAYDRGSIPIKAAIDFDLGQSDYVIKGVSFYLTSDPFGSPASPGHIETTINRFNEVPLDDSILVNLGTLSGSLDTQSSFVIDNITPIHGKIAVVLDLHEYQNMMFDANAVSGNTWITEPNRPWTDALGRGVVGAADIRLTLQSATTGITEEVQPSMPVTLSNYPNPFNPETTLKYNIQEAGDVVLSVFNIKGQQITTLVNERQEMGIHTIRWTGIDKNGHSCASGIYFVRLANNGKVVKTHKVVLLK